MTTTRRDALPENVEYTDDGCNASPSCLTCPLAVCIYDSEPDAVVMRKARNRLILKLHKRGKRAKHIASVTGLSERSVYRVIQDGGVVRVPQPDPDESPLLSIDAYVALKRIRARKPWPVLLEGPR